MGRLLYEKLITGTPHTDQETALMESLNKAQVFSIDNVAEYFWQSPQIYWDLSVDFPNMAPPFQDMYFEYLSPKNGMAEEGFGENPMYVLGLRFGVLCHTEEIENKPYRWQYTITPFTGNYSQAFRRELFVRFAIREDGSFYNAPNNPEILCDPEYFKQVPQEIIHNYLLVNCVYPVMLAISFMHCKNVVTTIQGRAAHIGKRNRRGPRVTFKVLEIEPMKKVLRTEGQSETTGLKKALHICRGHFKDFRESGLFGKLHDIYWWDSQVRGSQEAGMVFKDYKIGTRPHA